MGGKTGREFSQNVAKNPGSRSVNCDRGFSSVSGGGVPKAITLKGVSNNLSTHINIHRGMKC